MLDSLRVLVFIAIIALASALFIELLAGCASSLTPAEHAEIADTASKIAKCENEGRHCTITSGVDCYEIYEACMRREGL